MSKIELQSKVDELRELRRMAEELSAEISSIEDELKAFMNATDTDNLCGANYKITWKPVTSTRLDSKALKAAAPEMYEKFSKTTSSRRFVVA